MENYAEYFDNLPANSYSANGEIIQLKQQRIFFDSHVLQPGFDARILINSSNIIPSSSIIKWKFNYNCFDFIKFFLHRSDLAVQQGTQTNLIGLFN